MGKNNKRRSFQSLFGSPGKPKTGVAQVARSSASGQVKPPRNMTLSFPFTASMNSLISSQAEVSVDEFADTDSLGHLAHSQAEIEEAETIYSIISGYEDAERDSRFLFMEDFSHNSGSPDKSTELAKHDRSTEGQDTFDHENTSSYETPHASVRESQRPSISSAELLGRLRSVEIVSNSGSGSRSSKGRYSGSSRSLSSRGGSRVSFSTRSRDSRGLNNLTAGIDSSSGLPVTLYTVQDAEHQPNRWSLFAGNNAPQLSVPPVPGSLSSNSANGVPSAIPEPEAVHHGPFAGGDQPHHSVATISTRALRESGHSVFGAEQSTPYALAPVLPQSSKVSDKEAKRTAHNHMYDDSSAYNDDIEKGPFLQDDEQLTAQPWAKWAFLMIMGLVCVPIYFLLAFGFFDFGGYRHYLPRVPFGPVNRRYFACYTYWQKLWSFVIGLVWLCLVFAAIAIAFGLRARFH